MKRFISLILAVLIITSCVGLTVHSLAAETDFSCGENATWSLSIEEKTLTITGTGVVDGGAWGSYYSQIETIIIGEGITVLSGELFYSASNVVNLYLPSTLIKVESYVLYNATNLTNIVFPNGSNILMGERDILKNSKYAKQNGNAPVYLGTLLIGYNGTAPDNTSVTIKEGTLGVALEAFRGQKGIAEIIFPDSLVAICDNAFEGTAWKNNLPDEMIYAGNVFYSCGGITELNYTLTLREGTKGIAADALNSNGLVFEVIMPDSVLYIGDGAFFGANNLKEITVSSSLKYIDDDGFNGIVCTGTFEIPASVVYIGIGAFSDADFTKVTFEEGYSVERFPARMFDSCQYLKEIEIPECVKYIEDSVFWQCWSIKEITIPKTVEYIGGDRNFAYMGGQNDMVINCYKNSAGHKFAEERGFRYNLIDGTEVSIQSLMELLEEVSDIDRDIYTQESLAQLDRAVDEVDLNTTLTEEKVQAWETTIRQALGQLILKDADYSGIYRAIEECEKLDKVLYSTASYEILTQKINAVDYTLKITEQSTVDNFEKAIRDAMEALIYADVVLRNEVHDVIVSATAKEIYPTTALTVDLLDPSNYEVSNFAVGGNIKSVKYYDINLILSSEKVQPNGSVWVKISIPDGVDPLKCRVYHVTEDPVDPLVRFAATLDGNYIVFETDHFSEYAVIEVEPYLSDLVITKMPSKLNWFINEKVNFNDMEVTAVLSDGQEFVITDYDVSAVDTSSIGEKTVNVYYTYKDITKNTSFKITVSADGFSAGITYEDKYADEVNRKIKWYKLYCAETMQLGNDLTDIKDYTLRWSSDNKKVLVDNNGKVTNKGWFFARKATITLDICDKAGNVIATDSIIVRFFKFDFQLSRIQSVVSSVVEKLIVFC